MITSYKYRAAFHHISFPFLQFSSFLLRFKRHKSHATHLPHISQAARTTSLPQRNRGVSSLSTRAHYSSTKRAEQGTLTLRPNKKHASVVLPMSSCVAQVLRISSHLGGSNTMIYHTPSPSQSSPIKLGFVFDDERSSLRASLEA